MGGYFSSFKLSNYMNSSTHINYNTPMNYSTKLYYEKYDKYRYEPIYNKKHNIKFTPKLSTINE